MKEYKQLLEFIDYFKDDSKEFYKWVSYEDEKGESNKISSTYPVYEEKLQKIYR